MRLNGRFLHSWKYFVSKNNLIITSYNNGFNPKGKTKDKNDEMEIMHHWCIVKYYNKILSNIAGHSHSK